ncbi:MAG: NAD-dependent epimerase/dehydratase family protein [Candidatus Omnitrophota bacterium]|jgi:UDP-glucose 4-epimerase|nr:MAG: NAD-dependent epimerase/dehydratase family protein [Candidatus Omnitrophota bacterium]
MAYLVTGCAGFIGGRLCEILVQRGNFVIGLDALTDYYDLRIKQNNLRSLQTYERFRFIQSDLVTNDLKPILEQVDCVFHTAGQPGVRGSWGEQFHLYLRNNIQATQRLLESIKSLHRNIKVVFSSSSSIYGNTDQLPTSETALPRPYSPYGATKLAAEHLCSLYCVNYGIPTVSLRYFTVYGPGQRPDMAFHIFIKALLQNAPIKILGDGSQTRDFTYVDDIVAANLLAAEKSVEGEIFNIGGGSRVSLRETLSILETVSGLTPTIHYEPPTKGDVRDTSADTNKARRLLGYEPKTGLEEGLRRQFGWEKGIY